MTAAWRRLGQSPWLFAGPAVAAAVVFVWLPMVSTLGLSFFDWSLLRQEGTWRGLDHYRGTIANPDFHLALVNTGLYLLALLPLQVGVPLVLAFALVRVRAKTTGRLYRTALFAPSVLSFPVAAVVWLWLFNPTVGLLNTLTGSLGVPPQRWLSDPDLAIWSVIIVAFWKSFGLNLLIFLAALANVPTDVTEAARIDGAGAFRQAVDIELPLISPALFFAIVTTIIVVLDEIVGAVDVLTEGGPYRTSSNLLYFLYERGFRHFQFGEAAAVAVLIAAIVASVTWAQSVSENGMSTTTDAVTLPRRAAPAVRPARPVAPRRSGQIMLHAAFVIACLVTLFPLLWMLRTAFAPSQDVFRSTLSLWPDNATIGNFAAAFRLHPVGTWFVNSVVVAGAITLGKLAVSVPAGFAFGAMTFRAAMPPSPWSSAP